MQSKLQLETPPALMLQLSEDKKQKIQAMVDGDEMARQKSG